MNMKLFADITKRDEEQRMVWGYASTEAVDSQGEVVKLDAIKGAWEDYMKFANIREMHQPSAVGKCVEYAFDDKGVKIGVKVVDDTAWQKVVEGVYSGFSIGGKALNKADGVITQLRLTEISLVDRPANPEAVVEVWKGEGIEQSEQSEGSTVEKGMYETARFADMLETIAFLTVNAKDESAWEGDNSPIPAKMAEWLKAGAAIFAEMAAEEMAELVAMTDKRVAEKAAVVDDLAKAGARYSASTKAALAEVHGMLKKCDEAMGKLGYAEAEDSEDDQKKAAEIEGLRKSATETGAVLADIAKALGLEEGASYVDAVAKMQSDLDAAKARVKELEAMPAPAPAPLNGNGIDKGVDTTNQPVNDEMAALQKKAEAGEPLTPAELMKYIHSNGGRRLV